MDFHLRGCAITPAREGYWKKTEFLKTAEKRNTRSAFIGSKSWSWSCAITFDCYKKLVWLRKEIKITWRLITTRVHGKSTKERQRKCLCSREVTQRAVKSNNLNLKTFTDEETREKTTNSIHTSRIVDGAELFMKLKAIFHDHLPHRVHCNDFKTLQVSGIVGYGFNVLRDL